MNFPHLRRLLVPLLLLFFLPVMPGCMGPIIPRPRLPASKWRLEHSDAPPGTVLRTDATMGISGEVKSLFDVRRELSASTGEWALEEYRKDGLLVPPGTLLEVTGISRNNDPFAPAYRTYLTILSGKFAGEKVYSDWMHSYGWVGERNFPKLSGWVTVHRKAPGR